MNELIKILDEWDVHFTIEARRMDIEGSNANFFGRNIWKAVKNAHSDTPIKKECKWEGFADAKECLEDCVKQLSL